MKDNNETIRDISLLYELALSVGNSLDITENCELFLRTLLSRKNLASASVWIVNQYLIEENDGNATLVYAIPKNQTPDTQLPISHPIFSGIGNQQVITSGSSDPAFRVFPADEDIREGSVTIFPLRRIGVLKIVSTLQRAPLLQEEIGQLTNVISKFAISIEGCIAHKRMMRKELEERINEQNMRKSAEIALQNTEALYQTIFESTGTGMMIMEEDMTVTLANSGMEVITGYNRDDIIGRRAMELVPADERERVERMHRKRLSEEGRVPDSYEIEFITRAGDRRNAFVTVTIIPGTFRCIASVVDITDHTRVEDALKKTLAEKEILIKEIHHRVKNNLQVISALLALQADFAGDETTLRVLQECQNRIISIALVHEKLYQSQNITLIDMGDYIRNLLTHLLDIYQPDRNRIGFDIDVDIKDVDIDTGIPCGLIVSELISNSLKYAFPDHRKGRIFLEMKEIENDVIMMRIGDSGVGLPSDFDIEHTSSLGLHLVHMLATAQLRGTLELKKNEGITYIIKFIPSKVE